MPLSSSIRRSAAGLVVCAALFAPLSAFAADWSKALPAPAVESYLSGEGVKVLVAAAGGDAAERDAAAKALTDALRASKRVKLVLPDDALGDLSALDDAAIVAKAKAQPVDQVFVARVFPGDAGAWSAVVTMYAKDGTTIEAFTGGTSDPLAARATGGGATAGAGLSTVAVGAIQSAGAGLAKDRQAAVDEFEKRAIYAENWAAVDARNGQVVSTWTNMYKGKYKEPLPGAKLYEYIGRDDLAKKYRGRSALNAGLFLGGLGGIVGGSVWLAQGAFFYPDDPESECYEFIEYDDDYNDVYTAEYDACASKVKAANQAGRAASGTAKIGGITLLSAGTVAMMVPLFHKAHPVSAPELRQMVDEYNADLKKELGLDGVPTGASSGMRHDWSVSAGPWVQGEMVGGTLRVDF